MFLLPEARHTSAPVISETPSTPGSAPEVPTEPTAESLNDKRPQREQSPPPVQPTAPVNRPPPPQLPPADQELSQWNCSHQQKTWMKLELESMGLWPGLRPVSNPMKTFSLWRLLPQPELIDSVHDLPSPKYFQLHPFFILVIGEEKYPALLLSAEDTGERFGLEYLEPDCRPVPLDWDKHKSRKDTGHTTATPPSALSAVASEPSQPPSSAPTRLFSFPSAATTTTAAPITTSNAPTTTAPVISSPSSCLDTASGSTSLMTEPELKSEPTQLLLPIKPSPSGARTGPVKTGGRVFVLDHKRWPAPMKATITTVPVVTMPPATVNPPPPAHTVTSTLTQDTIDKIVQGIIEKQQKQQPAPVLKKPHTKKCLSCGQPESKYEGDGSSIHEFYQQGPVRYFYCSKKVFDTYRAEGLADPRMPFKDFVDMEFFKRELESTRKRVEEKQQQKRKREESPAPGSKCRFCKQELRQGPNSPHIHTGFSGVPGKYIYCPAKMFSLYKEQGMEKEMSWREFQQSPFYEKEKQRWGTK